MLAPDDNDAEEAFDAVPSSMFDAVGLSSHSMASSIPSVSSLGGWATGAGSALFAVRKVKTHISKNSEQLICLVYDVGFSNRLSGTLSLYLARLGPMYEAVVHVFCGRSMCKMICATLCVEPLISC